MLMLHSRPCSGGLAFTVFSDTPSYDHMAAILVLMNCYGIYFYENYHIVQNYGGENFSKFGKTNVIHLYFTQPNSRFSK